MSKLWLYGVFHLNLAFSSIPKSHYALILDRCYWPLLDIAQKMQIPFGFETTGYTLELLEKLDASYVKALKTAWQTNEIEFVGSGYTQSIMPLCPAEVNRQNLLVGNTIYQSLLGKLPKTAYVNEQTYSSGLVDLYLEAGYTQLFMEWNNPARFNDYPPETRYRPQRAINPDGSQSIGVIWNDSIAFQKLQRVLNQSLSIEEYFTGLKQHASKSQERGFSFYGSDAEIIDYHPGDLGAEYLTSTGSADLQRLIAVLERIQQEAQYTWVSPNEFAAKFPPSEPPIRLESPEYPLPCKKQPKYNPTRWAISGRDDATLNTKCFERAHQMAAIKALSGKPVDESTWRHLLEKWGSDFRTYTTDEKIALLRHSAAALEQNIAMAVEPFYVSTQNEPVKVVLYNPNLKPYTGPVVLEVQLPPHQVFGYPCMQPHPQLQATQVEDVGYYQDGSVRWVKAVVCLELSSQAKISLVWESGDKPEVLSNQLNVHSTALNYSLSTPSVKLVVLPQRGGAIQSLQFPQLDNQAWAGTLPHGYFDDITLGADFYSGHFMMATKSGERVTDLSSGQFLPPDTTQAYPIRVPIQVGVQTALGSVWKTLYVYQTLPRIDLKYHFRFQEVGASSCRLGMITILPEAFDLDTLAYRTVNGGIQSERFALKGHQVTHSEPVSVTVSAQHGLGATEGWVAIEDSKKRLLMKTYPEVAYTMPMVAYQEAEPGYFLRVLPSMGEFDDTSHTLRRGHHQVIFSWIGQKASESVQNLLLPISLSSQATVLPV